MKFEQPYLLWLLPIALPALALFFWWSWRVRQRLIAQFVQARLLTHLTVGVSRRRQRARAALIMVSVAFVIIALARPQWGYTWEDMHQKGLDVIVAIDTSRSMLAADVAPNRLARAKFAALDLKRLARTDRIGLIAFAGTAFLQCPLSFDDEAFRQNVESLDVNIIPQGGSAIAEAIDNASQAFKEKSDNYNVLVLFTDGEDNEGRALKAAKAAAKQGLIIFTVGVGTPNGELLRVTDAKGRSDYVRDDQGHVVKSRLNEQLLRNIAEATKGFYLLLAGANTMDVLYERGLAPLPKTEQSNRRIKRFNERYQWFLGLAILLLGAEIFFPERQRAARAVTQVGTTAAVKAAALLLILAIPSLTFGSPRGALKKYEARQYDSAKSEYERLLRQKPQEPRLHFNAGAAAFQAGDYEKASRHFNSALLTDDVQVQEQAYYNLGNAQFRAGENASEPQRKQEEWEAAVKSYDSATKLDANDNDARFNLEFVRKKLEELKKQQQQQQQQQKNSDQDKKDEQKDKQQDQSKSDQQQKDKKEQDEHKNQEQQKKPEDKQSEQPKPEDKSNSEKKDQQQQDQNKQQQQQSKPEGDQKDQTAAQSARAIPMTPKEAQRLLDTLKNEEKAMIFLPHARTNRNDRVLKDW